MIVWLNGAHGAGKTSVAKAIMRRRPEAWLFDPEQIGFLVRRLLPGEESRDFKEVPLWRTLTRTALAQLSCEQPSRMILVPMTLCNPDHFEEVVEGLRRENVDVRHFTLLASPRNLRSRLRWRPDWPSSRAWALEQVESCAAAAADPLFERHVRTDGLSVPQLAEAIMAQIDLGPTGDPAPR